MGKRFTVITPTILRPSLVDTCVSIQSQRYDGWQHIVVVDLPADKILPEQQELIGSIQHRNRLICYCETAHRNFGNTCKNRGFQYVSGDYLLYLDDDDVYLGEVFETLNQQLSDQVWGVFPIERFGVVFFNLPPRKCYTASCQFFYKPLYPFPESNDYCADGDLVDLLRERHPYLAIRSKPLARVARQGQGKY